MKTIAFTEWHRLSIDGKTHVCKISLASGIYYLTTKDPTRVFLISDSKISFQNEISLDTAKEMDIL